MLMGSSVSSGEVICGIDGSRVARRDLDRMMIRFGGCSSPRLIRHQAPISDRFRYLLRVDGYRT